ncbi:MAG: AraC family transcriptional regulator [Victivallaceae bacterium]|nr:AraC family transcriptional regulator [Victivallaceae bacterium]
MDFNSYLPKLDSVGVYVAPSDREIVPVTIPPGRTLVELLTGGQVYFPSAADGRLFGRGTIFWHWPGEQTICRTPPENPYRCVTFRFDGEPPERIFPRVRTWCGAGDPEGFAEECLKLYHGERLAPQVLSNYCYYTLLRQMLEPDESAATGELGFPASLRRAVALLEKNPALPIKVAATRAGTSEPNLFRLFRRYLGKSPYQYALEKRLGQARLLLVEGRLPVKEIAAECGFESVEGFHRRFRASSGMSPGAYRARHVLAR